MAAISTKTLSDRSGREFTIRSARPDDVPRLLAYIQSVAAETSFFVIEHDEFPEPEAERAWIQDHLDHPSKILVVAESEGSIIGNVSFEPGQYRRVAHRGTFGISVAEGWRGKGVGTALLTVLLEWAGAHTTIEKIALEVFATNSVAIQLYRKLGFIEDGRRIRDIKRGPGDYVDTLSMYRFV